MICDKCKKYLPDGSTFCAYCGSKISINEDATIVDDNFLQTLANFHTEIMQNPYNDEKFQNDEDYGLSENKPIMIKHMEGAETYLKMLRTKSGKPLKWKRIGSVSSTVEEGIVDKYMVYVDDESCSIYLNMYAEETSKRAPKKFALASDFAETVIVDKSSLFETEDNEKLRSESNQPFANIKKTGNYNQKEQELNGKTNTVKRKTFIIVTAVLGCLCIALTLFIIMSQGTQDVTSSEEYMELARKYNAEQRDNRELEADIDYIYSNICIQREGDNVHYHKFNCDTLGDSFRYMPCSIDRAEDQGLSACPICF